MIEFKIDEFRNAFFLMKIFYCIFGENLSNSCFSPFDKNL